MTPELEAELNKIGWKWASRRPWLKLYYEMKLVRTAGLVAGTAQEAKRLHVQHAKLCDSIVKVVDALRSLSVDAATSINLECTPIDARASGLPDHVEAAAAALENLAPGLILWSELLGHEAGKAKSGRPKNEPAHLIAEALAEIYVIGFGRKPSIGYLADKVSPSGQFGKVTATVLLMLGVQVSDTKQLCEAAIKGLTNKRMQELISWHKLGGQASVVGMTPKPRAR